MKTKTNVKVFPEKDNYLSWNEMRRQNGVYAANNNAGLAFIVIDGLVLVSSRGLSAGGLNDASKLGWSDKKLDKIFFPVNAKISIEIDSRAEKS